MKEITEIPLEKIRLNPWNVNFLLDHERVRLRDVMAKDGAKAVPPILVREKNGIYEIVDGEQRWSIAKELGWKAMPAIVMDLSDEEAKRLCLSYNILRGRADWFRLAEIMAEHERADLAQIYAEVLTSEEIDVILALNNLDMEARRLLRKLQRETGALTLQHLAPIIKFPKEYQVEVAENLYCLKGAGVDDLKDALRRYVSKKPIKLEAAAKEWAEKAKEEKPPRKERAILEEAAAEEEEAEEKLAEECREEKVEAKAGEAVETAAEEKAVYFVCECGVQYKVDFEGKTVERVRKEHGMDIFQLEDMLPAVLEVKCPRCGAKGKIDVSGESVEWSLA